MNPHRTKSISKSSKFKPKFDSSLKKSAIVSESLRFSYLEITLNIVEFMIGLTSLVYSISYLIVEEHYVSRITFLVI